MNNDSGVDEAAEAKGDTAMDSFEYPELLSLSMLIVLPLMVLALLWVAFSGAATVAGPAALGLLAIAAGCAYAGWVFWASPYRFEVQDGCLSVFWRRKPALEIPLRNVQWKRRSLPDYVLLGAEVLQLGEDRVAKVWKELERFEEFEKLIRRA